MLVNSAKRVIRSLVMLAGIGGLWAGSGCGEIERWWLDQRARPIHQGVGETRPGGLKAAGDDDTGTDVRPGAGFCQLVLMTESSSGEASPGLKEVELGRASARAVGELLGVLYVPAGPVGTTERYALVYPSRLECEAAADLARDLDVPTVQACPDRAPDDVEEAFDLGIGLLYGTPLGHPQEAARLGWAEASLLRTLGSPDQPAKRRWAAGMIAADVRGDRLDDYDQAQAHLLEAGKVIEARSLEYLATLYAQARASVKNGEPDAARKTLRKLIDTSRTFESTEVFSRARETRTELERKQRR